MTRRRIEEDAAIETTEGIHTKYRPRRLSEVIGQKAVVNSLRGALTASARSHAYLFTGPAGTGKTTLARIAAAELDCDMGTLVEVDAASKSGVDDMRALVEPLRYAGFGEKPGRGVILDECHRLSKNAWDSLLKITEEAPAHVFFFFCTTEPDKVPAAIQTRCLTYNLGAVKFDDIMDILEYVCQSEKYELPSRIVTLVAQAAEGSPRRALTMLAKVSSCTDEDEARELLAQAGDNPEVIDLCRMLVKGNVEWADVLRTLKSLSDIPPETIRILIVNYLNACIMGARNDRDTTRLLDMLEAFSKPCNPSDKLAPLLIAFGRIVFP